MKSGSRADRESRHTASEPRKIDQPKPQFSVRNDKTLILMKWMKEQKGALSNVIFKLYTRDVFWKPSINITVGEFRKLLVFKTVQKASIF